MLQPIPVLSFVPESFPDEGNASPCDKAPSGCVRSVSERRKKYWSTIGDGFADNEVKITTNERNNIPLNWKDTRAVVVKSSDKRINTK